MAYWWINQKEDDFGLLEEDEVLAVPRRDKLGKTLPAFATAAGMKPGDIGFVFAGGELDGVLTVMEAPKDEAIELAPEFERRAARVVPVRYVQLAEPVAYEVTSLVLRAVLPLFDSPLDPASSTRDTVVFAVDDALAARLRGLAMGDDPSGGAFAEAVAAGVIARDLPEERKSALLEARFGLGGYGESVLNLWDRGCAATGARTAALIQVAAIKSWAVAEDDERVDPENALPLVATWAVAFLEGLIAFGDDGALLLSETFPADDARRAGIDPGFKLAVRGARQAAYLAWHRERVFHG
ncbi:MAG: hypothetical protein IPK81_13045 [Rhodospirillales bacterium]|nr:hypothetical protein [Rhodospirillales bacterium]QQS10592.1 MAG: hypothetical protein IPK81_13045 [Rhodospirillales bacterium]